MCAPSAWEREAQNWARWARTPGHDVFPRYAPSFVDEIAPPPHGRTLEVGCGEGRMMRLLASRGHDVAGVDISPTLLRLARDADPRRMYLNGDATALPFADAAFDTVVAYNSLQTFGARDDMARAVAEAARVLAPAGYLCVAVAHPLTDIGHMKTPSADDDLRIAGSYFKRQPVDETVEKDGLTMTFHGWTHTLEDYARALEAAGLVIERVREPLPHGDGAERLALDVWRRIPLFLFLRARKS
jgi:SAM-dependent methyltransferase